jgi:polar amino acid transport system substrate-binding protein
MKRSAFAALLVLLAMPLAAQTLERVRAGNILTLGYVDQLQPFSAGPVERPVGYVIELCQRVAERIKREEQLPQLQVRYRQVERARVREAVQQGEVDLLCSPFLPTLERRRSISFSLPIYPSGRGVAVRNEASPALLRVLEGQVARTAPQWRATVNRGLARGILVVIAGSATERWVRDQLRLSGVVSTLVPVQNFAEGTALLAEGKADAFIGDRVLLQSQVAASRASNRMRVLDRIFDLESAALAMARGDEDLRLLVDSELSLIYRSGEIEPLYRKYFGEPSEQVRLLFKAYALP